MFSRIFRMALVETYKLTRQRLFYIALFLICLTVIGSTCADKIFYLSKEPGTGFTILGSALLNGFKIGAIALLIFGSLMVASEMTTGTIKTTLIRPYRRSEWWLAKALVMLLLVLFIILLVVIPALVISWQAYGFTDVTDPVIKDYVHLEKVVMLRYFLYSCILVILPLIAIALMGLFISTLIEQVGSAVALAILLYLALEYLVLSFFDTLAPFCFTSYLDWYLITWRDLSQGILGEISKFQMIDQIFGLGTSNQISLAPLIRSIVVPLAYSLVFGIVSLVVFQRKDIMT